MIGSTFCSTATVIVVIALFAIETRLRLEAFGGRNLGWVKLGLDGLAVLKKASHIPNDNIYFVCVCVIFCPGSCYAVVSHSLRFFKIIHIIIFLT